MKFVHSSTTAAILAATFVHAAVVPPSANQTESEAYLVAELRLAPTEVDRLNILTDSQVRHSIDSMFGAF
jgi:hypothetical protein